MRFSPLLCGAFALLLCCFASLVSAQQMPELVKDIQPGPGSSGPFVLTAVNGKLYFTAFDANGGELWVSDGTEAGTNMVRDLNPGSANASPYPTDSSHEDPNPRFPNDGTNIFFVANDGNPGLEVYTSDGTSAGTMRVTNIGMGVDTISPRYLKVAGDRVYFRAVAMGNEQEPYWAKADGTFGQVRDINPGSGGSYPYYYVESGNKLYFAAYNPTYGEELWAVNLTTFACDLVADINPGSDHSEPFWMVSAEDGQDGVFFRAYGNNGNAELWFTDGSANGTRMVKEINPSTSNGSDPDQLAMLDGVLYFSADDGTKGNELWRSDGTDAGTYMLKDIVSGSNSSDPTTLRVVGDRLFFLCDHPSYGNELWITDGTESGTRIARDIFPGPNDSYCSWVRSMGGFLFFTAWDGVTGIELYRANAAGDVELLADMTPGPSNSVIEWPEYMDGYLYFAGDFGQVGRELYRWAIDPIVMETRPAANSTDNAPTTDIDVVWNQSIDVNSADANSFVVHAGFTGVRAGQRSVMGPTLTFSPNDDFDVGEEVEVVLTDALAGMNGLNAERGHVLRFRIAANGGPAEFDTALLQTLGASGDHSAIASADFDGDGDLDLAVASDGSVNQIYLNDGSGTFTLAPNNAFGTGSDASTCLVVGDIDNDGDPDIIVGNRFEANVAYFNDGSGFFFNNAISFGPRTDDTRGVALGDLNADGYLDLVVANYGQQNLVHLNDGSGDFSQSAIAFGTGFDDKTSVAIGDVDADFALDIAVGNLLHPSRIYYNDGNADFSDPSNEAQIGAGAYYTTGIALGNLSGGAKLEVVLANRGRSNLLFTPQGRSFLNEEVSFTGADQSESVLIADFNGDDALDIAFGNANSQNLVWMNDGAGGFGAMGSSRNFGSGADETLGLISGDFDGDGDIDLALANNGAAPSIAPNEIGTPTAPTFTSSAPTSVVAGELYSYSITANAVPLPMISVSGNPSWLTLAGNLLSGTPSDSDIGESGTITITLSNGVGNDATQSFTITVTALPEAPSFTSAPDAVAAVGQAYSYTVIASGSPSPTITAMNLPAWLTLSGNVISGTPSLSDAGPDGILTSPQITLRAENSIGATEQHFAVSVLDTSRLVAPVFQSQPVPVAKVLQEYSYQITAIGSPAPTLSVSGLPAWLSFDESTGIISGTPTSAEVGVTSVIEVIASNGSNSETRQSYQIVVLVDNRPIDRHRSFCALSNQGGSSNVLWLILLALAGALFVVRSRARGLG